MRSRILANGVAMPEVGLGLYKTRTAEEVPRVVAAAWEAGYRLFDTASIYENERELGAALRALELPRDALWITTKVWNDAQREDRVRASVELSLEKLGLDRVDMLLLHWPVREKTAASWAVLEQLYEEGLTRSIGVSNFLAEDVAQLRATARIMPMLNQIELHPRLNQRALLDYCRGEGIAVQAHSTIMRGRLQDDPTLNAIAARHGKSVSQVILRWHLQNEVAVIPKTGRPERLRENIDLYDFALSAEEMAAIDALDNGERCCADPLRVDF